MSKSGRRASKLSSVVAIGLSLGLLRCLTAAPGAALAAASTGEAESRYYLPDQRGSKIVTVVREGNPEAEVVVLTQAVAVKETGPKETIDKYGEVYAFSPAFIAVHRDQPTLVTFWNLQSDDDHDFALLGSDWSVLMYVDLPPLRKTSYLFTFHKEGLFDFKCMQHSPAMSGQILVLPPANKTSH
jgi:plastocyanin